MGPTTERETGSENELLVVEDRAARARFPRDGVDSRTTGDGASGEFRCTHCGYGVIIQRALPRCPMCSGTSWRAAAGRPIGRFGGGRPPLP